MAYNITKEMKEEDTMFLEETYPKRRLEVDQGALLKRNQGDGALVLGGSTCRKKRGEDSSFYSYKTRMKVLT